MMYINSGNWNIKATTNESNDFIIVYLGTRTHMVADPYMVSRVLNLYYFIVFVHNAIPSSPFASINFMSIHISGNAHHKYGSKPEVEEKIPWRYDVIVHLQHYYSKEEDLPRLL